MGNFLVAFSRSTLYNQINFNRVAFEPISGFSDVADGLKCPADGSFRQTFPSTTVRSPHQRHRRIRQLRRLQWLVECFNRAGGNPQAGLGMTVYRYVWSGTGWHVSQQ